MSVRNPGSGKETVQGLARVSAVSPRKVGSRSLLNDVVIDFGPADVLGRLFPKADSEVRRRGVTLTLATVDELVAVNRANSDSWRPVQPGFDPVNGGITEANTICVIGRTQNGKAVTAHACRLYNLTTGSLKDELESLRLFYSNPDDRRGPEEAVYVTAPSPAKITGRVVCSGAVWYHPYFRKAGLMPFTNLIVRALSFTKWYADVTFSFMVPELVKAGIATRGYFTNVEWDILLHKTPVYRDGTLRTAYVSSTAEDQIRHFREFVGEAGQEAEVAERRKPAQSA